MSASRVCAASRLGVFALMSVFCVCMYSESSRSPHSYVCVSCLYVQRVVSESHSYVCVSCLHVQRVVSEPPLLCLCLVSVQRVVSESSLLCLCLVSACIASRLGVLALMSVSRVCVASRRALMSVSGVCTASRPFRHSQLCGQDIRKFSCGWHSCSLVVN